MLSFRHRRLPPLARYAATILAALLLPAAVAGAGPMAPAEIPLDDDGTMHIRPGDRCPVCAMRPYRYPKSACAIQLTDGRTFYFCETGCMLRTWLQPDIYLGVPKASVGRLVAQEYFTGAPIDAGDAIWVAGSDVIGPMGPMIVPVESEAHLKVFQRRHGGHTVFRLPDFSETMWHRLFPHRP